MWKHCHLAIAGDNKQTTTEGEIIITSLSRVIDIMKYYEGSTSTQVNS